MTTTSIKKTQYQSKRQKIVDESDNFKNVFSDIFRICEKIEKKHNTYGSIESKETVEIANLNLYKEIWNHPENSSETHKIWLNEIFIANKKIILKNSNKDAWLRDSNKYNVLIFGGKSNRSKPYKIDLCYFYRHAHDIASRVKKEEDEENAEDGFDEVRLPMRNCHIRLRYWLYRCFALTVTDEKDRKAVKKQLTQIRSILDIDIMKNNNSSISNIMSMAKNVVGKSNLSNISKSVYDNLKESKMDGTNPDKIAEVISKTVKSDGFKNMVTTMTSNAQNASISEEMEAIAKEFSPEVADLVARDEAEANSAKEEASKIDNEVNSGKINDKTDSDADSKMKNADKLLKDADKLLNEANKMKKDARRIKYEETKRVKNAEAKKVKDMKIKIEGENTIKIEEIHDSDVESSCEDTIEEQPNDATSIDNENPSNDVISTNNVNTSVVQSNNEEIKDANKDNSIIADDISDDGESRIDKLKSEEDKVLVDKRLDDISDDGEGGIDKLKSEEDKVLVDKRLDEIDSEYVHTNVSKQFEKSTSSGETL